LIPKSKNFLYTVLLRTFFILLPGISLYLQGAVEPLVLKHAEELHHVKQGKETYLHLEENVRFQKGAIHITCDDALHYPDRGLLILEGQVTVWDTISRVESQKIEFQTDTDRLFSPDRAFIQYKNRTMEGNTIRADLQTNRYTGRGNVIIRDSLTYSHSDSVYYDYQNRIIHYYYNASVADSSGNDILSGDYIRYQVDNQDLFSDSDPVFTRKDRKGEGQLLVYAGILNGNTNTGNFKGEEGIRVLRDSLEILSDSLEFSDEMGIARFKGSPRMFYKENRLEGDRMDLSFEGDRLLSLKVSGHSKMESDRKGIYKVDDQDSSVVFTSLLTGRELWVWFDENNDAKRLEMKGMAESDYHVFRDSI